MTLRPGRPTIAPGETFEGRYEIVEKLGEGGFGAVFKARQLATGQLVAVKALRMPSGDDAAETEKRYARFRREMTLCARIHHPNIVRLIDSGQRSDGLAYTVFEFVPGKSLADMLAERGALDPREALHLMAQVLDALCCAHEIGVIHRDLKPANVMVIRTGARPNAMVLDFGIGAFAEGADLDGFGELTSTNEALGTPSYAAPEQIRGGHATPRSDLYAWALTFMECLTGQRVIVGDSVGDVLFKQMGPDPVPIPLPLQGHALGRILARVTKKDPAARRATASELLRELESCDISDLSRDVLVASVATARAFAAEIETIAMEGRRGDQSSPPPAQEAAHASRISRSDAERRHLTAVCCNLVAMTTTGALEPAGIQEELDDVVAEVEERLAEIVDRHGGVVAGGLGDQMLFYFESTAVSVSGAAHAALEIVAEVEAQSARLTELAYVRLEVRIGIHTGPVVTRDSSRSTSSTLMGVGTTPRTASRLTLLARASGIVVSSETRALLEKEFVLDSLGDPRAQSRQAFALRRQRP